MPMRCRCPPEKCCGYLLACIGSSPTSFSRSATRFSISAFGILWTPIGSAMMSKIGIRGSRDAIGSWNTTCRLRRSALRSRLFSVDVSLPSTSIVPAVGVPMLRISSSVVVLPQPDSPTSPRVSPSRMSRSIPSTACTVPIRRR